MRNTRPMAIIAGLATMLVIAGILIGLISYADSRGARLGMLSQYFHALALKDDLAIKDLTTDDFTSDLPLTALGGDTYELYDFGASELEGKKVQRFLLVATGSSGGKQAWLADMYIVRQGLVNEISGIKLAESGAQIKK